MKSAKKSKLWRNVKNARYIYLLIFPAIVFYIIFNYIPMYGVRIAFQDFFPRLGISGSPSVGWDNFRYIFAQTEFWRAFRNTLVISLCRIALSFVFSVGTALILNEIRMRRFKKLAQTVFTFPHFLSWVIIAGFVNNLFMNTGVINNLVALFGGNRIDFLRNKGFFFGLLMFTEIWKEAGWGSIVYLATMAGIDAELYDAAEIDGASRFRRIVSVTLPGIRSTAVLLLILSTGSILTSGFDQIFNLYNPLVYEIADILDTYIYRTTFGTAQASNPGYGAAVGLFKSVVSCALVLLVDRIAKLTGERGII
ncbi:MAG: sugar ABC transporter permease [Clostridia bacterium]|jgi:putative aldouronate transport system permease protein|nr:sugar ABC transporter permease [Clostridia bacterium]